MTDKTCGGSTKAGSACKAIALDNGFCRHHGGVKNETVDLVIAQEQEAAPVVGDSINRQILSDMTHESLVLFARLNYGMQVSTQTSTKGDLVELVMNTARRLKGNAEMKVVDMDGEVEVPPGYVKVRIQGGKYNPNNRPVPVGLNFKMATIPVNKDVVMHEKWLTCLKDAVRTEYFTDRSDPTRETLGSQEAHSYPYSVLERG